MDLLSGRISFLVDVDSHTQRCRVNMVVNNVSECAM